MSQQMGEVSRGHWGHSQLMELIRGRWNRVGASEDGVQMKDLGQFSELIKISFFLS